MRDVFWWCSAMAGMDTRDTRAGIRERHPSAGSTSIKPMLPPEEVTTFNFVRRLVFWQIKRGGQAAATLHSRALEGGWRGRRPPSGADLELAVEVTHGRWVNLLLQAKRIYEPAAGGPGIYSGWKSSQIDALRRWARSENRTPGMLLYNAEVSPFGGFQTNVTLGGCCKGTLTHYGSKWPPSGMVKNGSPLAITFVILPDSPIALPGPLRGNSLPADVVNQFAAPIECIFCPNRQIDPSATTEDAKAQRRIPPIPLSAEIPTWAGRLMVTMGLWQRDYQPKGMMSSEEERDADYSVVLPAPRDAE